MILELLYYFIFAASVLGLAPHWLILAVVLVDAIAVFFEWSSAKLNKWSFIYRGYIIFMVVLNYYNLIPADIDLLLLIVTLGWFYGRMGYVQQRKI
ncbi:MAG: hypothetical protein R6X06_00370 [Gammaproteobacteria bacterium]